MQVAKLKVDGKLVGETAIYAVIGILLVFIVLLILMGFIYLIGMASKGVDKLETNEKYQKFKAIFKIKKKEEKPEVAKGTCGEIVLDNTTEREAAMIMAIVANQLEVPLNTLKFKSIKQISEGENK